MARARVEFHPEAVSEARAAARWYAAHSLAAADAFVAELLAAVEWISEAPRRWPAHVAGTRRYLMRRFPFSVVYRESKDSVQVVAIAHARRRPGYWKERRDRDRD